MNARIAQQNAIVKTLGTLSLDELAEALDEIGAESIDEAMRNMHMLGDESIARYARIVDNLARYSQRVEYIEVTLVYEGNREVVRVVSGSLDELAIVVIVGNEEVEFEKGSFGDYYEINDAQTRYTFEK